MSMQPQKSITMEMLCGRLNSVRRNHGSRSGLVLKAELNGETYQLNTNNFKVSDEGVLELELSLPDPAVSAIAYVLEHPCESPMEFLRCWNEGDFEALRSEWEDVPAEVFIGADPLYQKSGGDQ